MSIILLLGCHNPITQTRVEGQYELLSVNGEGLPCCSQTIQDTISARIGSGYLEIGFTPGRYEWSVTYMYSSPDGRPVSASVLSFGSYTVQSDRVTFVDDSTRIDWATGVIFTPSQMLINRAGSTYSFIKLAQLQ
jgi:hypothetical protein